jgi:hypothetical protein
METLGGETKLKGKTLDGEISKRETLDVWIIDGRILNEILNEDREEGCFYHLYQ